MLQKFLDMRRSMLQAWPHHWHCVMRIRDISVTIRSLPNDGRWSKKLHTTFGRSGGGVSSPSHIRSDMCYCRRAEEASKESSTASTNEGNSRGRLCLTFAAYGKNRFRRVLTYDLCERYFAYPRKTTRF